ncbi:hypothetical protein BGZ95_010135 [Linnemannia exigua]|uniref:Uncharacterized protein n=1 Tax=Linnemannia exigua TaxID=604196 RepID=A0AAD4DC39_9FUNG|nr:hypothetical protein BGZ95_010135 [Linnemannia exigua]
MKSLQLVTRPLSPTRFLANTLIILFILSTNYHHQYTVSAQTSFTPTSATGSAFARTQTKLYILGGDTSDFGLATRITNQFISLDLNVSWNVTAPAWQKLPDSPFYQSIFPAAFSSDDQTMYVFHIDGTNSPSQYSVTKGKWSVSQIAFQNMAWQGLNVVTDPRTGLMYIPGGYNNVSMSLSSPTLRVMEVFDPITLSINQTKLPVQNQVFPVRWYYQNVWSSKMNATLYFGGNNRVGDPPVALGPANVVTAFAPDTPLWFTLYTPPASYATLKPPPKITRTIPPWGTATSSGSGGTVTGTGVPNTNPNNPSPTPAPVPVGLIAGGVVGGLVLAGAVAGIFFIRYRRNQWRGRGFFVKPSRDDSDELQSLATGAASLSAGGSNRRRRDSLGKDPMESNEEYELERTLMDIEEQKRELEMRQQLLVLQHRAENPDPQSAGTKFNTFATDAVYIWDIIFCEIELDLINDLSSSNNYRASACGFTNLFNTNDISTTILIHLAIVHR